MPEGPAINITVTSERDSDCLVVVGDVDSGTAPLLDDAMSASFDSGATMLTVDFSGVAFLSSAGLSSLVAAQRRAQQFRLLRGNRQVDRLITLTGLEALYGEFDLVNSDLIDQS